jgi:hypothetical protein
VQEITDGLPAGEYGEFDVIPGIRNLANSPGVRAVVRGYLQAEPVLLEYSLIVACAESLSAPIGYDSQRHWHFDYAGWHSLNVFVYLTDVAVDSGAHQMVVGTHRGRRMWDAVRGAIPDGEIRRRFSDDIRTVTGPAGTMFFEDTSAFHRRGMHFRRRVMLNVLFASHRSWLGKGRLTVRYLDYHRKHLGDELGTRRPCA